MLPGLSGDSVNAPRRDGFAFGDIASLWVTFTRSVSYPGNIVMIYHILLVMIHSSLIFLIFGKEDI